MSFDRSQAAHAQRGLCAVAHLELGQHWETWFCTVLTVTPSSRAMAALSLPAAISASTCASRSVRSGLCLRLPPSSTRCAAPAPKTAPPAATVLIAARTSSCTAPLSR